MANQIIIDIGAVANDGTGDPLRTAFGYVNDNFSNVWATGVANANIGFSGNKILTVNTNGNLVLAPNGTGRVVANVDIVPNMANVRNLGALTNRWSTVYSQYLNVSGEVDFTGDVTVGGNLTVTGNTIQIGNITTETKTIQLANSASTANAANGSGVTVGANDNIATMLYSSTSNTWVMNIGANITGNVTAPYFIGNGALLTGIVTSSYANANAVAYGQAGWAGNIIPATSNVYSLGNSTNQWSDLYVSNATIYMNNVPISLTAGNVLTVNGNDVVTTNANGTVNLGNLTVNDYNIYNAAGQGVIISNFSFVEEAETAYVQIPAGNSTNDLNVVQEQGNVRLVANTAVWNFDTTGNLTIPNGGYINFVNTGGITQAVNEDLRFTVSDDEEDGWAVQSTVNDGAGNDLTRMQVRYDGVRINTDLPTNNYSFDFRDTGEFDVPKSIRGPVGGNLIIECGDQSGSTTFIDLQTRSYVGDALISNIRIGDPNVTISTSSGAYNWTFGGTGNVTIPGAILGTATIALDNRATGNTADIQLYSADDILVQGRDKPNDSESEGGDINIYAGDGANAATEGFDTGGGGDISITGGLGGSDTGGGFGGSTGGTINISSGDGGAGDTTTNAGSGGSLSLSSGSAAGVANTALGGVGGSITITAGDTTRINEIGGSISLNTGAASGDGTSPAGYLEINIPSSNVGPGGTWTFSGVGNELNVPGNSAIYGANFGNFTVGCAGNTIVTSSEYGSGNVKNWVFGYTGNLLAPGNIITPTNFVGASLRTSLTNFNFVRSITNITTGATTVITLDSWTFDDTWDGQVVITDVTGTTEANATWWYQAADIDQFVLYTDNTFTTPVDSSTWGAYTGGGLAVTLDYNDITINAQNVTISSGTADYNNRVWTFGSNGTTIFPTLRVDLHNGGNQSGQVLQFGDNQQAIITGPTPAVNNNAERIIIQGQRGLGTGEGGDVYLWGGDSDGTNGGDIKIYAGDADGVGGTGGYVNIDGGAGSTQGGPVEITGGSSSGTGGEVNLVGGGGNIGGNVGLTAGYGSAGAGGSINIQAGGSANGLAEYGNVNISAGASTLIFDNTGNLVLPVGGNLVGATANNNGHINWVGNSSGDGNGYTTMILMPDDTREAGDQYLILDPTAPGHIHIRAGGTQDNSSADLFLGGENTYFRVYAGSNSQAQISANSYNWTFGTDSVLTVPGEGVIRSIQDTVILQSYDINGNTYSARLGTTGGLYFETTAYPLGWLNFTNSSGDANISSPSGSINIDSANGTSGAAGKDINITAGDADQTDYYTTAGGDVNITGGLGATNDGGGGGHGGNVNITAGLSADPAGVAGNVTIGSGTNYWQFNNNGNLQVPGSINGDNNGPLIIDGNGSGIEGYISLPNTAFGSEQIRIVNQFSLGNGISLTTGGGEWHFADSGALFAPGAITATGTISSTSNGAGTNFQVGDDTWLGDINISDTLSIRGQQSSGANAYIIFGNASNVKLGRAGTGPLTYEGDFTVQGNISGNTAGYAIGYRDIPQVSFTGNATLAASDAGKHYYSTLSTGNTLTIPNNSSVSWPVGTAITVVNRGTGNITIAQDTGVNLYLAGNSTASNRTLTTYGMATLMNVAGNVWMINGTGVV